MTMSSAILDLQKESMVSNTELSDLLRKAYVISRKLKVKDFEKWINLELNGYGHSDNIPRYRVLNGTLKYFNPFYGYSTFLIENVKINNMITQKKIDTPIAELEDLYKKAENTLYLDVTPEMLFLKEKQIIQTHTWPEKLEISISQLKRIFDSVKNIILEWSIKLEEDGILGENLVFSPEEKEIANKHITNYNTIFQDSQVQFGEKNLQIINKLDLNEIKELLKSINNSIYDLDLNNVDKKELEINIKTIDSQLESTNPNENILIEAFKSIRSILEGCISTAIAPT